MSQPTLPPGDERELHEQTVARLSNLAALEAAGLEAFGYRYDKTHSAADLHAAHPQPLEPGQEWPHETARVAGRLVAIRTFGKKLAFATLQDATGRIQLMWRVDDSRGFELVRHLDLGDLVGAEGSLLTTRTGELTLLVTGWMPLVKSLHPLPDKHRGLTDPELRARRRYLDLIANPESARAFLTRSRIVRFVRNYLDQRGFMEVEGPTLQAVAGGTEARPFRTFHNALSHEFSLRIALELHLKRLLVGGLERVYEIGRVYRNEGVDQTHNPEFTMLEFYWAYADYMDVLELVQSLLSELARELHGGPRVTYGEHELDFTPPFRRLDFTTALRETASLDFDPTDLALLRAWTNERHPELAGVPDYKLLDKLFGQYVEHTLVQPTFVMDFPTAISPLARRHRSRPGLSERWDLFVAGVELSPAYSELNDARDQRARFEAQTLRRDAGDLEAHEQDEDFLLALEYGMPPAGGCGIGIDRLTMLMTDRQSLRDVILFPLLRPEKPGAQPEE